MTPQMQQSIQLLQLNAIELEELAQEELLENPFLTLTEEGADTPEDNRDSDQARDETPDNNAPDEASGDNDSPDSPEDAQLFDSDIKAKAETDQAALDNSPSDLPNDSQNDFQSEANNDSPNDAATTQVAEAPSAGDNMADEAPPAPEMEKEPEQFDQVDLNWDEYYSDSENSVYRGTQETVEEHDFTEYVAHRTSIYEHLNWQLRCSVLDGVEAEIGEYLIGNLDGDGYMDTGVVIEAAQQFGVEVECVERVLNILQEFDPPGIAARSLAECLIIQMKILGSYTELAREVLEGHMKQFQRKKFREVARQINVDESKLIEVYRKVCRLEPHPGRSLSTDSVQYIHPDVYVKIIDGQLMIYLNEGQTGRLSVDRFYRRLMRQQEAALTDKEREYAVEKFRAALTLIKNIEKRKSTILRVTEAIVEVQREFLDQGVEALKPLTLREIADVVGMHESTVARVTAHKYVETPQGVFPLKFFFSSSIESAGADAVSSRAIKDKIRLTIQSEDPKKPLSDQKLAEMLNDQGFEIARRTVAKYREQMKILPAKFRRET